MFSPGFLTILVYGALIWCAIASVALAAMLIRDIVKGESW